MRAAASRGGFISFLFLAVLALTALGLLGCEQDREAEVDRETHLAVHTFLRRAHLPDDSNWHMARRLGQITLSRPSDPRKPVAALVSARGALFSFDFHEQVDVDPKHRARTDSEFIALAKLLFRENLATWRYTARCVSVPDADAHPPPDWAAGSKLAVVEFVVPEGGILGNVVFLRETGQPVLGFCPPKRTK